jgi:ParB family chromosome partitioning protein
MVPLPLDKLVPTPLNPRTNFGSSDELTELGESLRKRQLQPVVVVSRASYLDLFPEHESAVGPLVSHVIITGERRYRGARQVGLGALSAVILEEIASSRSDILDAVLSENIDRKNFDPIEEAAAVQAMVRECGTAVAAAQRFRRTGGWVSQRLSLLRLAPEVQILVRSGEIPVRDARGLARLDAHEQLRTWRAQVQERQQGSGKLIEAVSAEVPVAQDVERQGSSGGPSTRPPAQESAQQPAQDRKAPPPSLPVQPVRAESQPTAGSPPPASEGSPGEPDWAVDDTSEVIALARSLVSQFSREERRRLVSYLLSIDELEKASRAPA